MLNRIHHRLGTAGFLISILALIAALGGGAYAASGGLTGKQKKEVEKIAKKYAGAPGSPGAAGAAGPAGAKGDKGDPGVNGTNGGAGTNGTSVTTSSIPTSSATCNHKGGVEVKSASPAQTVCNGETGFTKTLPPGQTETGTWSVSFFGVPVSGTPGEVGSISFPIPLEAGGSSFVFNEVQTELEEFGSSGCKGTAIEPTAPEGVLCVYTYDEGREHTTGSLSTRTTAGQGLAYGPSGALLTGIQFSGTAAEPARATLGGSWAVTAPKP